jgi:uncharacterized integral membrane protein
MQEPQERGSNESGPQPQPTRPERRSMAAKVVVALALVVLLLVFATQNSDPVPVKFLFLDAQIPLFWVYVGCAAIGAAIMWLLGHSRRRTSKRYIKELERRVEERD